MLASGGSYEDGTLRLWDVHTGEVLNVLFSNENGVEAVAFSPDGRTVFREVGILRFVCGMCTPANSFTHLLGMRVNAP